MSSVLWLPCLLPLNIFDLVLKEVNDFLTTSGPYWPPWTSVLTVFVNMDMVSTVFSTIHNRGCILIRTLSGIERIGDSDVFIWRIGGWHYSGIDYYISYTAAQTNRFSRWTIYLSCYIYLHILSRTGFILIVNLRQSDIIFVSCIQF